MKVIVMSGLIGAAIGFAVVSPDTIMNFYDRVYPQDPARREALDLCYQQNHDFNRLDHSERSRCYESTLPATRASADLSSNGSVHAANFIDLWQAAGRGHMTNNDVRAQEESTRVLHPAAAR